MKVAWKVALSTLLLLCIGTGRATWIDSVAVIDAVSEPEPSQELENASDGEEPPRPPGSLSAEDARRAWAEWSTLAANPNRAPEPSREPEVASTDAEDGSSQAANPDPNPQPHPHPNPSYPYAYPYPYPYPEPYPEP